MEKNVRGYDTKEYFGLCPQILDLAKKTLPSRWFQSNRVELGAGGGRGGRQQNRVRGHRI